LDEPSLATSRFSKSCMKFSINFVVKARHRREDSGLQNLTIFGEFSRVSLVEANSSSHLNHDDHHALFK
jgi:hypothetical protein